MRVRAITRQPCRADTRAEESRAQATAVENAVDVRTVPRAGRQACFTRRMKAGTSRPVSPSPSAAASPSGPAAGLMVMASGTPAAGAATPTPWRRAMVRREAPSPFSHDV